jgi:hypothetical protein
VEALIVGHLDTPTTREEAGAMAVSTRPDAVTMIKVGSVHSRVSHLDGDALVADDHTLLGASVTSVTDTLRWGVSDDVQNGVPVDHLISSCDMRMRADITFSHGM